MKMNGVKKYKLSICYNAQYNTDRNYVLKPLFYTLYSITVK